MVVNRNIDIEAILSTSGNFRPILQISFTTTVDDITRMVIKYEHSGMPCVITEFPTVENDEQSLFRQSEEWIESIYTNRGVHILIFSLQELQEAQPDNPSLSEKSETLKRGLPLLDEAINSSHCLQDELLPTLSLGPEPPLCSFCRGEIFRNVFCCAESCVCDGATGDSVHCKILICSYCFIDGRACRCGSMKPYKTQSLALGTNTSFLTQDIVNTL